KSVIAVCLLLSPSACLLFLTVSAATRLLLSFPTRRSSDLKAFESIEENKPFWQSTKVVRLPEVVVTADDLAEINQIVGSHDDLRSEEHTSELQSLTNLVCRLLLEKKKHMTRHRSMYYHTLS